MLMATAGHVDHGKTTLVRALTGTDCDRLAEEKRRGITISLGYALWTLKNGDDISMVDVPGHERLVRTMLSGAGGMDAVLVVISGEAGVMPQTREHLNACWLLGIPRAVVAMTFSDRLDEPDAAIAHIRDALSTTYHAAPIIPVCALTGEGLDALDDAVSRLSEETQAGVRSAHPPLLPIDRVFSIDGHGTVVTGSLLSGELSTQSELCVIPGGHNVRCRSIQVHGQETTHIGHGHRVAVNLTGEKQRTQVGQFLTIAGAVAPGRVFDAEVKWLTHNRRSLTRKRALTLHMMGHRTQADVKADAEIIPGGQGTARIRLDRAIPLPPGSHFVLRGDPTRGFGSIVGGGRMIDAHPRGRRDGASRQRLAESSPEDARALLIMEAGPAGLDDQALRQRLPLPWVDTSMLHFDPARLQESEAALCTQVQAYHQAHPTEVGVSREHVARSPLEIRAIQHLLASNRLIQTDGRVHLPSHRATIDPEHIKLKKKLMKACGKAGLNALHREDLLARFPVDNRAIERALRSLIDEHRLVHTDGFYFAAREALGLRKLVATAALEGRPLPVSWLKEKTGLSRKHAIPLWTWLDRSGTTRREGNVRVKGPMASEHAHE